MKIKLMFLLFLIHVLSNPILAEENIITIYYNKDIGQVNKKIFGNNFLSYEPELPEARNYYDRADYGLGVWNPKYNNSVKEVIELVKEAGISAVRFAADYYDWKDAIGNRRSHFLYGIDEFLKTTEEIGAEPSFIISYFIGNEQDAADFVEYLNAPCDGKHPWADKRAENGHPEPYGVKYFELGNEVWGGDHRDGPKRIRLRPEDYAEKYLRYQDAMKKVDPSIQLGVTWWDSSVVLEKVGSKIDFVVMHVYPPRDMGLYGLYKELDTDDLFKIGFGATLVYSEKFISKVQENIKKNKKRDGNYIVVNEYNTGIGGEGEPLPYRHTLGSALINAELIRILMKPEHGIIMANYWHFSNDYWGMIKSVDNFMKHDYRKPIRYIKRPNYYVYELYNSHFGGALIGVDVKSETYDVGDYEFYKREFIEKYEQRIVGDKIPEENLINGKWKIDGFPEVYAQERDGVLEIDFENPAKFNYFHSKKKAKVIPNTYYKLSGYIKTDGLIADEGICLEIGDSRGWVKTHSSKATESISGTTDWQYVDVIYKTLPDTHSVDVAARRVGDKGPLKGKAFLKSVSLEEYTPPDTSIPYLSVNASKGMSGDKIYLIVINKNAKKAITSLVELKEFSPTDKAEAWILNGPYIDATNEKKEDNVKVAHREIEIKTNPFTFTFEPHSLTAIELNRRM